MPSSNDMFELTTTEVPVDNDLQEIKEYLKALVKWKVENEPDPEDIENTVEDLDESEAIDNEPPPPPVGPKIGAVLEKTFAVKAQIDELKEQIKALNEQLEVYENFLLHEMDTKELEKIGCEAGTGKYAVKPFPKILDHVCFFNWVFESKRYDMIEKRVGRKAFRAEFESTGEIPPGLDVYMKPKLELRKKSVRRAK